jgi:hypothetical protein
MTDYEKTYVIRQIVEDGEFEEFVGQWYPGFRTTGGDCVPRAHAINFIMIAMDFELFRTVGGKVNLSHVWNAYWDSTVGAIRFVDAGLSFDVWNLFIDELDEKGFLLDQI